MTLGWGLAAMLGIVAHTTLNVCGILYGNSAALWVPIQVAATAIVIGLILRATLGART